MPPFRGRAGVSAHLAGMHDAARVARPLVIEWGWGQENNGQCVGWRANLPFDVTGHPLVVKNTAWASWKPMRIGPGGAVTERLRASGAIATAATHPAHGPETVARRHTWQVAMQVAAGYRLPAVCRVSGCRGDGSARAQALCLRTAWPNVMGLQGPG